MAGLLRLGVNKSNIIISLSAPDPTDRARLILTLDCDSLCEGSSPPDTPNISLNNLSLCRFGFFLISPHQGAAISLEEALAVAVLAQEMTSVAAEAAEAARGREAVAAEAAATGRETGEAGGTAAAAAASRQQGVGGPIARGGLSIRGGGKGVQSAASTIPMSGAGSAFAAPGSHAPHVHRRA